MKCGQLLETVTVSTVNTLFSIVTTYSSIPTLHIGIWKLINKKYCVKNIYFSFIEHFNYSKSQCNIKVTYI